VQQANNRININNQPSWKLKLTENITLVYELTALTESVDFWTFPSPDILNNYKTQRFGNWICFHPQVGGSPTCLKRQPQSSSVIEDSSFKGPNKVSVFPSHLTTKTNPVSETLRFIDLEYGTTGHVQNPSNFHWYTPSSAVFRIYCCRFQRIAAILRPRQPYQNTKKKHPPELRQARDWHFLLRDTSTSYSWEWIVEVLADLPLRIPALQPMTCKRREIPTVTAILHYPHYCK
jgi:hypothetical protein